MGSGVLPLAMTTRSSNNLEDLHDARACARARGEIRVNEAAVVVLNRSPRDLLIAACDGSF
jgi:hypothetical protein